MNSNDYYVLEFETPMTIYIYTGIQYHTAPYSIAARNHRLFQILISNLQYSMLLKPVKWQYVRMLQQSSGAVWKSRWPSWAPVPNKPTVSLDVKRHFNRVCYIEKYDKGKIRLTCICDITNRVKLCNITWKYHGPWGRCWFAVSA